MNKNHVKGHANEAAGKAKEVAGKVTDADSTEHKDKTKKQGGKAGGAVLGDVNSDSKKKSK